MARITAESFEQLYPNVTDVLRRGLRGEERRVNDDDDGMSGFAWVSRQPNIAVAAAKALVWRVLANSDCNDMAMQSKGFDTFVRAVAKRVAPKTILECVEDGGFRNPLLRNAVLAVDALRAYRREEKAFRSRVASRWLAARDEWIGLVFDDALPAGARFAGRMDFQAVFMMGPPGAGKSFVKAKSYLHHSGFHDIDSDEMKKRHPDYDPMRPAVVHQWSLAEQERELGRVLKTGEPFVYDGTGWDPVAMKSRIDRARDAGYRVFLVYVYVPVEVSLFRNRNRGRFVPEDVIISKSKMIGKAFGVLRSQVDRAKVVVNFTDEQLNEAKADMAVYPPPQAVCPPRPGDADYGVTSP